MTVKAGDRAPDAALVAIKESGPSPVRVSELKGRKAVLLFFPLVNTGVCHKELCTVRDSMKQFESLNARVVAISVDSPFAFQLWAEKEGFNFEFWSDFNKEAQRAFGNSHEDLIGLKGVAKRSAFVIDKDGVVRYAWVSDDPKQLPNFDEVKKALAEAT